MDSLRSTKEKGSSFELIASSDDEFACGYKECNTCGVLQPYYNFRVEARGVGGRKARCKDCSSERTIKRPAKRGEIPLKTIRNAVSKVTNDRIQKALEAAAYRIIKESM